MKGEHEYLILSDSIISYIILLVTYSTLFMVSAMLLIIRNLVYIIILFCSE